MQDLTLGEPCEVLLDDADLIEQAERVEGREDGT